MRNTIYHGCDEYACCNRQVKCKRTGLSSGEHSPLDGQANLALKASGLPTSTHVLYSCSRKSINGRFVSLPPLLPFIGTAYLHYLTTATRASTACTF